MVTEFRLVSDTIGASDYYLIDTSDKTMMLTISSINFVSHCLGLPHSPESPDTASSILIM